MNSRSKQAKAELDRYGYIARNPNTGYWHSQDNDSRYSKFGESTIRFLLRTKQAKVFLSLAKTGKPMRIVKNGDATHE